MRRKCARDDIDPSYDANSHTNTHTFTHTHLCRKYTFANLAAELVLRTTHMGLTYQLVGVVFVFETPQSRHILTPTKSRKTRSRSSEWLWIVRDRGCFIRVLGVVVCCVCNFLSYHKINNKKELCLCAKISKESEQLNPSGDIRENANFFAQVLGLAWTLDCV